MADPGVDIDLYADVDNDFPAEDFNTSVNNDSKEGEGSNAVAANASLDEDGKADLYDDVLTNIKDEGKGVGNKIGTDGLSTSGSGSSLMPSRRYQVYVGNLTWWTTDADIADAVLSVGVNDFLEVKFYENRANGQSKGFCCVSLASESSMRVLMDKLPKKELHGQAPAVTYATKQALTQFEAQSKTRPTPPPNGPPPMGGGGGGGGGGRGPLGGAPYIRPSGVRGPPPSMGGRGPPLMSSQPPHRGPPLLRGPPPPHTLAPPPGLPPMSIRVPPPGGPPMIGPPMPHMMSGPPPPRMSIPGPGAHVNPAFFPTGGPPPGAGYPPPPAVAVHHHGLSENEFEEIMTRNRTVSSSAIARAVQDASQHDYGSAIETLVTAISLIRQSKVAHDDRCRILVSSLQDTLRGIEDKSYGARRERSRSRERHRVSAGGHHRRPRSYSREREYREHRERDYYRERSRSRERDYRREEKYYEERERYKHREAEPTTRTSRDDIERERGRDRGGAERTIERDEDRKRTRH